MEKRRVFSRDYKLAAVKKVVEQGLAYSQVARDLGIGDNLLHNWRKAFEADARVDHLQANAVLGRDDAGASQHAVIAA